MDDNHKPIDFRETTFYNGTNATYGKIPVTLEIHADILDSLQPSFEHENPVGLCRHFLKLELSAGIDKLYTVSDIGSFLHAVFNRKVYQFSKNFIFEPEHMHFQKQDRRLLDCLYHLLIRRGDSPFTQQRGRQIIFNEMECESLLDSIWADISQFQFRKPAHIQFVHDIPLHIQVERKGKANLMRVDYTEYGDFEPLTINFAYIYCKVHGLITCLPEEKREVMKNLYPSKNSTHQVLFQIRASEMRLFQKNFLDRYGDRLHISIAKKVKEEMMATRLLTKVYIDLSVNGIISKIEFCYGDQLVNPLDEHGSNKNFREFDLEHMVLDLMNEYGFKEYGRLFLLDDVEKIMFLLTDQLTKLKKIAEVYYSIDFKKLYVKNLDNLGLSLSEDESVIHMNINLENVSDEELAELLEAIKTGKKYYRLRNGSIVNLASVESSKLVSLINSLDIDKSGIHGGIFDIPLNRCMYIDTYLKEKNVEQYTLDTGLTGLLSKVSAPDEMEVDLSDHLKKTLRSYQLTGVKWLQTMASYSFGGVLADDMGLGKTIQVLAFLSSEKRKQNGGQLPSIVVAPTSVLFNWKSEAQKHTPELNIVVVTGTRDKRKMLLFDGNRFDVLITSYGALKHDIECYSDARFSYIFLDEAQNIKNPETLNAFSVKSLKAKCAFALTGTPIENKLTDLWSIFDFIMPGLLFDRVNFMRTYEEPIIREKDLEKTEELTRIIQPFIIRRLKRDVLEELPNKIETDYYTEMTEEQKKLYAAYYKEFKNELLPQIEESGFAKNQMAIFTAITRLRQIAAHPGTFVDGYDGGSGKLAAAMEIIHSSIEAGHSVLLFSQFTKMLKLIRDELYKAKLNCYYLDGTMKAEDRMAEVDDFNHDQEAVFLISLKAGGTGLNLTKADVVIHFDPWWNPAMENQASDRAHRFGQKNVVRVYNLLTKGTIEEKIAGLKVRKKEMFENFISPGEMFFSQLGEDEIRGLFELPDAGDNT